MEIGDARGKIGQILRVKPLAALAMIDEGELDWKIIAISLDDPRASLVNDVDDVEKHFPVQISICKFYPIFIFGNLKPCSSKWAVERSTGNMMGRICYIACGLHIFLFSIRYLSCSSSIIALCFLKDAKFNEHGT